jgi:hypothetical protein
MPKLLRGFTPSFAWLILTALLSTPLAGAAQLKQDGGGATAKLNGHVETLGDNEHLGTGLNNSDAVLKGRVGLLGTGDEQAQTKPLSGSVTGSLLQGGIKDEAALHSSLKMIPAGASGKALVNGTTRAAFPVSADLVQYSGRNASGPGLTNNVPLGSQLAGGPVRNFGGSTQPITSYALHPHSSVMWFAPGTEVTPAQTDTTTTSSTSNGSTVYSSRSGVNSYAESSKITTVDTIILYKYGPYGGVIPVDWKYGILWLRDSQESRVNGSTVVSTSHNGVSCWSENRDTTVISSRKGVTSWTPGYEVRLQSAELTKSTLGGTWNAPGRKPINPVLATAAAMSTLTTSANIQPATAPLLATPLLRSDALASLAKPLNWDAWNKRMAQAIYSRWQNADVRPGMAKLRITVSRNRTMSAEVVEFVPAADVQSDLSTETAFRQAAIDAIHLVSSFEIPEFPTERDAITFNLELKRTVDGPVGIDVASVKTPTPVISKGN